MVKKDSKIGLKKTFTEPEQHPLLEESSKSSKLPFSLQQLIPHYFWRINILRVLHSKSAAFSDFGWRGT